MIDKEERKRLCNEVVRRAQNKGIVDDDEINADIAETVLRYSGEHYLPLKEKLRLKAYIYASIRGLDVLQELLDDASITEIMVNGTDDIFIEKNGALNRRDISFDTKEKLDDVVQKIAAGSNRIINEASHIVDARLKDGSRVNMILPPIAINGPVITIRKFPQEVMTISKLIEYGSLTEEAADFLKNLVIAGYNIFVSGGTGSGKTTFLNALSNFIPQDQRVITIEDSAELQIKSIPNLVSLEVRNANVEGKNEISIRDLIKCSLRMRPDRLIIGEVRDAACIDMLQAMNTGHSGMSTGHANSTRDMLSRMETMVLLGADIPLLAVRRQIASAIDIIIQLGRFRDKSRKVIEITEVAGFENDEVILNPCFRFVEEGEKNGRVTGSLQKVGSGLKNKEKLQSAGL
ncbi:MAG: CpaF family protein [Lachnospiraceae bacterium]|nr:CpaF family protein [Lachnospiraceae bacterium]